MRTVLNGPLPQEVDDLLARRRALGLDTYDEVWNGEYHMNPSPNRRHARVQSRLIEILNPLYRRAGLTPIAEFNLGERDDYRVPDGGALREPSDEVFGTDAAIVVEVLSPDDESWAKFHHYARSGVEEIFIVDPDTPTVRIFALHDIEFVERERSALLNVSADHLTAELSAEL